MELNLFELMDNSQWFPYHKSIAELLGDDPLAAIMLSYLISRHNLHDRAGELTADGYFYRTAEAITEDTRMKKAQREGAIKTLQKYGLIDVSTRSVPSKEPGRYIYQAARHFRVCRNMQKQFAEIRQTRLSENDKLDCRKTSTNYNLIIKTNNTHTKGENFSEKFCPVEAQRNAPPVPAAPPSFFGQPESFAKEQILGFLKQFPANAKDWEQRNKIQMTTEDWERMVADFCDKYADHAQLKTAPVKFFRSLVSSWLRNEADRMAKVEAAAKRYPAKVTQRTTANVTAYQSHYKANTDEF